MRRPYTICHVLCALNGKISGQFMRTSAAREGAAEYTRLREEMDASAWLYGTATAKEFGGVRPPDRKSTVRPPDGDFLPPMPAGRILVSIDPLGEVAWPDSVFRRPGTEGAHILEVLGRASSAAARHYMQERNIPYILSGNESVDCAQVARKLAEDFRVKRLLVCGGGAMDWAFLRAGLLDEVSIVMVPAVDGSKDAASVFDTSLALPDPEGVEMDLLSTRRLEGGTLHLLYKPRNTAPLDSSEEDGRTAE